MGFNERPKQEPELFTMKFVTDDEETFHLLQTFGDLLTDRIKFRETKKMLDWMERHLPEGTCSLCVNASKSVKDEPCASCFQKAARPKWRLPTLEEIEEEEE